MGLTDRSRLSCIKARQKLLQQKLNKQNRTSNSSSLLDSAESVKESAAQEKAWNKYMYAKSIYQETKDMAHWQYMQKCFSEYEKTLTASQGKKAQ
jgi:hypothetical protein